MPSAEHEIMVRDLIPTLHPPAGSSIEDARAAFAAFVHRFPVPEDIVVQEVAVGQVMGEWVQVRGRTPKRVIYYLHGGGYALGSRATYREFVGRIARATDARVFHIDYRLSPENPYPAGLDDARDVYHWLLNQGITPADLAIGGDSAGGGLTMGLVMRLRDEGSPLPAAVFCFSPMLDLEATGASVEGNAAIDPMCFPDSIRGMSDLYAPNDKRTAYASPFWGDYRGLPPTLFLVGSRETLMDDAVRGAAKGKAAGSDFELVVEPGLVHVWPLFGPNLPETRRSLAQVASFLDRKMPNA